MLAHVPQLSPSCRDEGQYTLEFMFDCDVECSFTILRDLPDTVVLSDLHKE